MEWMRVCGAYFSATGTTRKLVRFLTEQIAASLSLPTAWFDFTLPASRAHPLEFTPSDLVIFGTPVYAGMVVGVCSRNEDMSVNICKKKQLTNMRAAGSDEALRLVPPRIMSLEQCLEFLADDELLEVTPESLRIRKRILDHAERMKALKGGKN